MPVRYYNEYIKVDPNFIPVFSRSSDKTYPDKWQSFYPHNSFKTILKDVIETLEKSSESKDRSVWMSGAYGTGKTYASFVIKHILEDDIDSIEPYFTQNGMDSLLARIKGVRSKGRTLVVQRSASAGINTQDKLFNAIVESVRKAISDAGLDYTGAQSLSDKVLTILKNPETSAFNFQGAFNKYRAKFTDYSSVDSIIKDLEELDLEDKLDLLDTIIEVAAKEGFNWSMSTDEIIDWLEDVRKGNHLYSIVFIWDEFTEYFKNNQNNITGLQEISMASSRISCYFFLITHSSAGQLIQDKGSKKIIEARFKLDTIELEESTAFKLLGQALRHEPDLLSEWNGTCEQLWDGVKKYCVDVIKNKDVTVQDDDFKNLMPMHPYAAYLLKFIAKDISSNQRTIFQFLSGDFTGDETKTNFKWFIENYAFEYGKWNYLTVDYLWDYFFTTSNVDLDSAFMQTISHYSNYAPMCDDPSNKTIGDRRRRVLKATLLLAALQTKNGAESRTGATSLMRPTLVNIKACFAGTPIEATVEQDLNFFSDKGIVGRIENAREVLFVMTSAAIDVERMKQKLEETKKEITFEKLIDDKATGVNKQFLPTDFLSSRLKIYNVSPTNAKLVADKADSSANHIPTFFLFAKNEADQARIKDTIKAIYDKIGSRCIVVDFSALPVTDALFDKYIESKAKERYFQSLPNQDSQYKLAKKTSDELLGEWTRKLITTSLFIYSAVDKSVQKTGGANLRKELKDINSAFYGCGLEEISLNDKLFAESGFKETVAQMAMGKISVPANYSYVRSISTKLENDGIWSTPKYWEVHPTHPVSKMKVAINEVIEKAFKNSSMASVVDIWKVLVKPPFGLMPNTGSVFMLGFLLNEYADSNYYKRDMNNNTVALNYADLSELIYGVVKELPKAQGQFIVKQTPEQATFCKVTGEIFKIAKEKRNSIDDIAKNINIYLTNNKYPMWAIKYYIEEELNGHEYEEAMARLTDLFCEFVKPESKIGRERSKIVDDIYHIYQANSAIDDVYGNILNSENMRTGMNYYIAQYKPELITVASNLHVEPKEYLELLNSKLSSDSSYLWEIGDTNHQIDNLYVDLKLIFDINRVLTTKQKTYADARKALIEKLNIVKIPNALLEELRPELKFILSHFYAIKDNTQFNKADTSSAIANMADEFVQFFNNQFDTFCKAVDKAIGKTLSSDEYEYLFNKVPSGTLFDATDKFTTTMQHELTNFRKSKKTRKMYEAWEKATGTSSPADWSKQKGIPVLCMFEDRIVEAQKVFGALNKSSYLPTEQDIDDAIAFLSSGALTPLSDTAKCEQLFIEHFAGEYAYVVSSADDLRDEIRTIAGTNVYEWYAKAGVCKAQIKKYATKRYQVKYCSQAKEKIKKLSAQEAQAYLNQLIENDPLLGITILKGTKE